MTEEENAGYKDLTETIDLDHGRRLHIDFTADELGRPAGGTATIISKVPNDPIQVKEVLKIEFQNGPVGESGLNGVFVEDLLLIVAKRLGWYQGGIFRCRENALAITDAESSENWLNRRTAGRKSRGVEGTYEV